MAGRKNKGTSRDRSQCGFFFLHSVCSYVHSILARLQGRLCHLSRCAEIECTYKTHYEERKTALAPNSACAFKVQVTEQVAKLL